MITLPATKAGDVQYVPLSEDAKAILHDRDAKAAVAEAEAIANEKKRKRSDWVFTSKNPDTHIDPANFYRRVYLPAVKAAGLEGVAWHTLRHTFASRLAMSGASLSTIAALFLFFSLSEDAKAILHDRDAKAAVAEAEAIANEKKRKRSDWVFTSKNPDTHIDPANFYRRVYLPAVKAAGLEGVAWHTLRHTFASRLAMSGASLSTIAALLRHSTTALVG